MYAREFDGRTLTFGVSGKLIRNSLVMYDRETESLWSQFLGAAVAGELSGHRLEPLASTFTDWSTWRESHPDTRVLDPGRLRVSDPYGSYYASSSAGVVGVDDIDSRLSVKDEVLGVRIGGAKKAYAFRHMLDTSVVNDRVGGIDVLVVFDINNIVAQLYERTVDGEPLSFDFAPSEPDAAGLVVPMVDRETGSLWSGLTGVAVSGPLAGARLRHIPATPVYWFAWQDFYPETEIWKPAAD